MLQNTISSGDPKPSSKVRKLLELVEPRSGLGFALDGPEPLPDRIEPRYAELLELIADSLAQRNHGRVGRQVEEIFQSIPGRNLVRDSFWWYFCHWQGERRARARNARMKDQQDALTGMLTALATQRPTPIDLQTPSGGGAPPASSFGSGLLAEPPASAGGRQPHPADALGMRRSALPAVLSPDEGARPEAAPEGGPVALPPEAVLLLPTPRLGGDPDEAEGAAGTRGGGGELWHHRLGAIEVAPPPPAPPSGRPSSSSVDSEATATGRPPAGRQGPGGGTGGARSPSPRRPAAAPAKPTDPRARPQAGGKAAMGPPKPARPRRAGCTEGICRVPVCPYPELVPAGLLDPSATETRPDALLRSLLLPPPQSRQPADALLRGVKRRTLPPLPATSPPRGAAPGAASLSPPAVALREPMLAQQQPAPAATLALAQTTLGGLMYTPSSLEATQWNRALAASASASASVQHTQHTQQQQQQHRSPPQGQGQGQRQQTGGHPQPPSPSSTAGPAGGGAGGGGLFSPPMGAHLPPAPPSGGRSVGGFSLQPLPGPRTSRSNMTLSSSRAPPAGSALPMPLTASGAGVGWGSLGGGSQPPPSEGGSPDRPQLAGGGGGPASGGGSSVVSSSSSSGEEDEAPLMEDEALGPEGVPYPRPPHRHRRHRHHREAPGGKAGAALGQLVAQAKRLGLAGKYTQSAPRHPAPPAGPTSSEPESGGGGAPSQHESPGGGGGAQWLSFSRATTLTAAGRPAGALGATGQTALTGPEEAAERQLALVARMATVNPALAEAAFRRMALTFVELFFALPDRARDPFFERFPDLLGELLYHIFASVLPETRRERDPAFAPALLACIHVLFRGYEGVGLAQRAAGWPTLLLESAAQRALGAGLLAPPPGHGGGLGGTGTPSGLLSARGAAGGDRSLVYSARSGPGTPLLLSSRGPSGATLNASSASAASFGSQRLSRRTSSGLLRRAASGQQLPGHLAARYGIASRDSGRPGGEKAPQQVTQALDRTHGAVVDFLRARLLLHQQQMAAEAAAKAAAEAAAAKAAAEAAAAKAAVEAAAAAAAAAAAGDGEAPLTARSQASSSGGAVVLPSARGSGRRQRSGRPGQGQGQGQAGSTASPRSAGPSSRSAGTSARLRSAPGQQATAPVPPTPSAPGGGGVTERSGAASLQLSIAPPMGAGATPPAPSSRRRSMAGTAGLVVGLQTARGAARGGGAATARTWTSENDPLHVMSGPPPSLDAALMCAGLGLDEEEEEERRRRKAQEDASLTKKPTATLLALFPAYFQTKARPRPGPHPAASPVALRRSGLHPRRLRRLCCLPVPHARAERAIEARIRQKEAEAAGEDESTAAGGTVGGATARSAGTSVFDGSTVATGGLAAPPADPVQGTGSPQAAGPTAEAEADEGGLVVLCPHCSLKHAVRSPRGARFQTFERSPIMLKSARLPASPGCRACLYRAPDAPMPAHMPSSIPGPPKPRASCPPDWPSIRPCLDPAPSWPVRRYFALKHLHGLPPAMGLAGNMRLTKPPSRCTCRGQKRLAEELVDIAMGTQQAHDDYAGLRHSLAEGQRAVRVQFESRRAQIDREGAEVRATPTRAASLSDNIANYRRFGRPPTMGRSGEDFLLAAPPAGGAPPPPPPSHDILERIRAASATPTPAGAAALSPSPGPSDGRAPSRLSTLTE
ncbi:hypothetical protein PAPYR_7850 [Paratrimastix pyriformis]|uniref:Uncharacterized protein n=1 Tax=Paratrimastix pyriformis TaxID=342808 RepID=A0ABQ8UG30_9EUKA|nr:hypothetical protein PAPYR_7850 [Paratrimastix pyriformis]